MALDDPVKMTSLDIETIYNQEIDSIIIYKFGFLFHTFHLKYMYMDMGLAEKDFMDTS